MECLGDVTSVHSRSLYSSALGAHPTRSASGIMVYTISDKSNSHSPESLKPYALLPSYTAATNAALTSGCRFGNSCCGCKLPDSQEFQKGVMTDKPVNFSGFSSPNIHYSEIPSRVKDFGGYQGSTGSYPRIPGYIDIPVVTRAGAGDSRHDTFLPIEDCQPYWATNWSSQLYYGREQTQSSQLWKSSLADEAVMNQPDVSTSYRRGRKKRVPYTKLQLKELEREYTISKFITKDKRRRIASSTSLSERQVTIWFQNRRVKDKKICMLSERR